MKRLLGNLAGLVALGIPSFRWLMDIIGLASLPEDLGAWGIILKTMLEDPWLVVPAVIGLLIIAITNIPALRFWEQVSPNDGGNKKVFISSRGSKGTKILDNKFVGDRTAIDADRATDLEAAGNLYQEGGAAEYKNLRIEDALNYLAQETQWGTEQPGEPESRLYGACLLLRQAARNSEIVLSGREEISRGSTPVFSEIWSPIPPDYWQTHEFDFGAIMEKGAHWQKAEVRPENINDQNAVGKPTYAGLRVSISELEGRWPKINRQE